MRHHKLYSLVIIIIVRINQVSSHSISYLKLISASKKILRVMAFFYKNTLSMCLQLTTIFCICLVTTFSELHRFQHKLKDAGSLKFLVVGDWGRKGLYNQSEVAFQMGRVGQELNIEFVISTGDNFYDNGLTSVNDPAFKESFTQIYSAESLQKQWYAVLGNHDYRGDVKAQLSPVLRKIDRRWLILRSYVLNAGIAEFFFVDTTPFVDVYFDDPLHHRYDWRGISHRETYLARLLKDLESALSSSKAKWKIVVGHHAMRSVSHHGDTQEVVERILPVLKANNVDMYVNGHDHCLQHLSCLDSPIQFITSGAGSKAWRGDVKDHHNRCAINFFHDGQGFMSVQMTQTNAEMVFYDVFGKVIYRWNVAKQLVSSM
ncbi:purple acid phosphatase 17-like [Cornus florida]|uniref:purple acid phosphatase 17-like n=1 Tax=Cornus florida TaxID=4283 RepID=UPI00289DBC07|nr:purple acid phosphatase 17-like [Cornus florida]